MSNQESLLSDTGAADFSEKIARGDTNKEYQQLLKSRFHQSDYK
jgi:hypothetical protein